MEQSRNSNHVSFRSSIDFVSFFILAILICSLLYLTFQEHGMTQEQLLLFRNIGVLWVSSLVSGHLGNVVFRIPSLLAMIGNGILIVNLFDNFSIPQLYRATFTSMGLSIILLRSGLEMDITSLKKSSSMCIRLTCLPGLVEATVVGACSMILFKMNVWFGLSCGFMLAAVSPAIVTVEMLNLQSKGYGVEKGIPSLIIAAASMDDIFAIMGFSISIGLAVKAQDASFFHSILHGIYSIALGILVGLMDAIFLSATKVWNDHWKRISLILLISLSNIFVTRKASYPSAGPIASLILGVATRRLWNEGVPKRVALKAHDYASRVDKGLSVLWCFIFEPLLFGSIGFSLQFHLLPLKKVFKSVFVVLIGACFRFITAFLVSNGSNFTKKERLFVAISWLPKATVQAALCYVPLNMITNSFSESFLFYDEYISWATDICSIAVLSICITAPLGVICISYFGQKLLTQTEATIPQTL